MEVYLLMRRYGDTYGHPFRDPDFHTEVKGVYFDKVDANTARDRGVERARKGLGSGRDEHYWVETHQVKGKLPVIA